MRSRKSNQSHLPREGQVLNMCLAGIGIDPTQEQDQSFAGNHALDKNTVCRVFNGSTSGMICPDGTGLFYPGDGGLTLAAWIKVEHTAASAIMAGYGGPLYFYTYNGNLCFRYYDADTNHITVQTTNDPITLNTLLHVAVTMLVEGDNVTVSFAVNGTVIKTVTSPGGCYNIDIPDATCHRFGGIGAICTTTPNTYFFDGQIGRVHIVGRALTVSEIGQLFVLPGWLPSGLRRFYPLNEPANVGYAQGYDAGGQPTGMALQAANAPGAYSMQIGQSCVDLTSPTGINCENGHIDWPLPNGYVNGLSSFVLAVDFYLPSTPSSNSRILSSEGDASSGLRVYYYGPGDQIIAYWPGTGSIMTVLDAADCKGRRNKLVLTVSDGVARMSINGGAVSKDTSFSELTACHDTLMTLGATAFDHLTRSNATFYSAWLIDVAGHTITDSLTQSLSNALSDDIEASRLTIAALLPGASGKYLNCVAQLVYGQESTADNKLQTHDLQTGNRAIAVQYYYTEGAIWPAVDWYMESSQIMQGRPVWRPVTPVDDWGIYWNGAGGWIVREITLTGLPTGEYWFEAADNPANGNYSTGYQTPAYHIESYVSVRDASTSSCRGVPTALGDRFRRAEIAFMGLGDIIEVPTIAAPGTGPFTWGILAAIDPVQLCNYPALFGFGGVYAGECVLYYDVSSGTPFLRFYADAGNISISYVPTVTLADGQQHWFVIRRDGTTAQLYVDGQPVGTPDTSASANINTTKALQIGGADDSPIRHFRGKGKFVFFESVALSDNQIINLCR